MNDVVKLAVDTYKNNLGQYSADDANETLRKAFLDIAGTDKIDYKTMRRFKPELFDVIEVALDELIVEGIEDQFNEFVEVHNLAWGDSNSFTVNDSNLFKVATVADGTGNFRRQRLDNGSFSVSTATKAVKIYDELYRFLAGRIDWGKMVNKVAQSYNAQIASDIYTAIYDSYTALTAPYAVSGTYAEASLNTLVAHVEAGTYMNAVIMGTKAALAKVTTANVSENMKDTKNELGFYGVVNGTQMRMIRQAHTPGTTNFAINDSFLLVVPNMIDKMVKLVIEGDALIEEYNNKADKSLEYEFIKKAGVGVVKSSVYGIYRLS